MNLANAITVARLLLVPVFLFLAYRGAEPAKVGMLTIFIVASLSDSLDGYIARRNDAVTRLGQFLDPLADKILVLAALVVLVDWRGFPVVAAGIFFLRELTVQIFRNNVVRAGGTLPASTFAKAKTVLQIVMVSWWLGFEDVTAVHWVLLFAALAVSLWSGTEYFVRAYRVGAAREG